MPRFGPAAFLVTLSLATATSSQARISYPDGAAEFYGHVFPVQGPHGTRGAIGEFGAPRDGGRTHEGFDIVAACGTQVVAVRDGRVRRVGYDPVLYGNYLLIHGEAERRSYFYAHLRRPAGVRQGERSSPASGSESSARPATRERSAAICTSRSTSTDVRSTPSRPCGAGTATAEQFRRVRSAGRRRRPRAGARTRGRPSGCRCSRGPPCSRPRGRARPPRSDTWRCRAGSLGSRPRGRSPRAGR